MTRLHHLLLATAMLALAACSPTPTDYVRITRYGAGGNYIPFVQATISGYAIEKAGSDLSGLSIKCRQDGEGGKDICTANFRWDATPGEEGGLTEPEPDQPTF